MRPRRRIAALLPLVVAASCAFSGAPHDVDGTPIRGGAAFRELSARWVSPGTAGAAATPAPKRQGLNAGSEAHVGAFWIPALVLDPDARPKGPGTPPADVDIGTGWGARAGGWDDALGIDAVFATTRHDESRTGAELTTYQLYADLAQRVPLWGGPVAGWAGFGAGIGLARVDWDGFYISETTGLWQAKGMFSLLIGDTVTVDVTVAGFLWAHPTNTVATGAQAMLGGGISF